MTEPIELSFEVDCPAAHAFEVWTERISSWWPRSHTVSAEADATVMLERRVGGRIYERTMAGEEHEWGEVTAFEPPRRLSYLWHIRRDRADATEARRFKQGPRTGGTDSASDARRSAMVMRAARVFGARSILGVGAVHLQQYTGNGYSTIPTIGTLFLLNAIAVEALATVLLTPLAAVSIRRAVARPDRVAQQSRRPAGYAASRSA